MLIHLWKHFTSPKIINKKIVLESTYLCRIINIIHYTQCYPGTNLNLLHFVETS